MQKQLVCQLKVDNLFTLDIYVLAFIDFYMVKCRRYFFRLTKEQFEQIKQDARIKGCASVAQYVRETMLKQNRLMETRIIETHRMVKEILERQ